ncbi:MAG TPA: hypothetical protein ENO23_08775 [Alphaproteobacteria bacterium]|nr:hypothetical protein [Alphaproteobacteria bacterium]
MILLATLVGCGAGAPEEDAPEAADTAGVATVTGGSDAPGLIRVSAEEYGFNARSRFPSGWVNLRFENEGEEEHFLLVWRLPEGKTFDEYAAEVAEPFQEVYTRYQAGELDRAGFFEELTATIPEWFYEAVPMGGPGFTSPGHTSETLIYLEPGDNYVLECYVRSMQENHRFHGSEGMLRPLVVTTDASGLEAPEHDVEITISNSGLDVTGDLSAGSHVVRVRVEEAPEGFLRHNVHLARLDGDGEAGEAAQWLNWVDAMVPPAPTEFLGGAGQTVAGRESYVKIDLEPGRYAWVSEMFGIDGFLHEFNVD